MNRYSVSALMRKPKFLQSKSIYFLITGHPRLPHFNESILHLDTDLMFVSFTILDPA